jgi:hypothetical protein
VIYGGKLLHEHKLLLVDRTNFTLPNARDLR